MTDSRLRRCWIWRPPAPNAIYVGKQPGGHAMRQDEIDAVLVRAGTAGSHASYA